MGPRYENKGGVKSRDLCGRILWMDDQQSKSAHTRPFSTGIAVAHAESFSKHNEASRQVGPREHLLLELAT
jgi:hypothetical protein